MGSSPAGWVRLWYPPKPKNGSGHRQTLENWNLEMLKRARDPGVWRADHSQVKGLIGVPPGILFKDFGEG
jgi:hypothetical protein